MKVFNKVLILSLAILALSSSVAFGACKTEQSSDAGIATVATKNTNAQTNSSTAQGTHAGALGQGAGVGNGN